jgi:predicted nucleic acid-binding protein
MVIVIVDCSALLDVINKRKDWDKIEGYLKNAESICAPTMLQVEATQVILQHGLTSPNEARFMMETLEKYSKAIDFLEMNKSFISDTVDFLHWQVERQKREGKSGLIRAGDAFYIVAAICVEKLKKNKKKEIVIVTTDMKMNRIAKDRGFKCFPEIL